MTPLVFLRFFLAMARGRLGGSRSLLRGVVGNDIYQIVSDGSAGYEQKVYSRSAQRKYSNTDLQIRNRMIIGQVERMFHILPSIIASGYFNTPNGSMSFQRFSRLNYRLLKEDFDAHFSESSLFDWQPKRELSAPAGPWFLTDGQLTEPHFESVEASIDERNGCYFNVGNFSAGTPVRDVLNAMNVVQGDSLVLFLFRKNAPSYVPYVQQIIFQVSCLVDPDSPIGDTFENQVVVPADDSFSGSSWYIRSGQFSVWFEDANANQPYYALCAAMMVVRNVGSKTYFSPARFKWLDDNITRKYPKRAPMQVWSSWALR